MDRQEPWATVTVAPQFITINHGRSFLVTTRDGRIGEAQTDLCGDDTRYVSAYEFSFSGVKPRLLAAGNLSYYAALYYFTNPALGAFGRLLPENSLVLRLRRTIDDGLHEDYELFNYAGRPVNFELTLLIEADFADLFLIRRREDTARVLMSDWSDARRELSFSYRNNSFAQKISVVFRDLSSKPRHGLGQIVFPISLPPGGVWHACVDFTFGPPDKVGEPLPCGLAAVALERDVDTWLGTTPVIETDNHAIARAHERSLDDLASLRLEPVGSNWVPAAGVPWYAALFGRDSLITGFEALTVRSGLAVAALTRLAEHQGQKVDPWRDEEPGRILHELRVGELASLGKIPFDPYYGTADAPLLFVITLFEAYKFLGEKDMLERFREPARRCLEWAEQYGDIDGDGLIEYRPLSPHGYFNQGWKDSFDGIVYEDGRVAAPPLTVCEIQGYYYDALLRMAAIERVLGDAARADGYLRRAGELRDRFDHAFWWEEEGFYFLALDAEKRPLRSVASNPGHLLWSGIVPAERALQVASRLLRHDLLSNWGVRTLSSHHPGFNPISYHRGSVWPHDNALIAWGLKRYGFDEGANQIAAAIFRASARFERGALPELYAGLEAEGGFPALYLDANIPQAWAAASVFLLLRAILGLEPDPERRRLQLRPALPEWLPNLTVRGLAVLGARLDVKFWRAEGQTQTEVLRVSGAIDVVAEPPEIGGGV